MIDTTSVQKSKHANLNIRDQSILSLFKVVGKIFMKTLCHDSIVKQSIFP